MQTIEQKNMKKLDNNTSANKSVGTTKWLVASALSTALVLSACGGDDSTIRPEDNVNNQTVYTDTVNQDGVQTDRVDDNAALNAEDLMGDDLLRQTRVVYFDYDSSQIREQDRSVLQAHARFLRSNPQIKARLEGHADERGSREYNLGLGQRRANAARQFMMLTGVAGTQLQPISYGEEKPVSYSHDESSWQKNRRVEIVY